MVEKASPEAGSLKIRSLEATYSWGTLSWQLFYAASMKVGNFWKVDNFEAWRG